MLPADTSGSIPLKEFNEKITELANSSLLYTTLFRLFSLFFFEKAIEMLNCTTNGDERQLTLMMSIHIGGLVSTCEIVGRTFQCLCSNPAD